MVVALDAMAAERSMTVSQLVRELLAQAVAARQGTAGLDAHGVGLGGAAHARRKPAPRDRDSPHAAREAACGHCAAIGQSGSQPQLGQGLDPR